MSFVLNVNGSELTVDADINKPLLWVLREDLTLLGAKFGCGVGACGACTVLVDGKATRSCVFPAAMAKGKNVQTIEGLNNGLGAALKAKWVANNVPQCGYCQTGQLIAAYALLNKNNTVSDGSINTAMTNICRCGTYGRIRAAIKEVAAEREGAK